MDIDDLIDRLCTMAGMIMEDASAAAIMRNGDVEARVGCIADAARDINALSEAAARLVLRLE